MDDILCSIYLRNTDEDRRVIAYLDYRKKNNLRKNTYVQLAVAAFLNNEPVTLATLSNVSVNESTVKRRTFRISPSHPYYDAFKAYPQNLRVELVRCALRQAIQPGDTDYFMEEKEITRRLADMMFSVKKIPTAAEPLDTKPVKKTIAINAEQKVDVVNEEQAPTSSPKFSGNPGTFFATLGEKTRGF